MRRIRIKPLLAGCICGVLLFTQVLSGCGREITENEIKATKLYQDIDNRYTILQRKYNKLKKQLPKETTQEETTVNAKEYFRHMRKSAFIKVKYASVEQNMKYKVSDNVSLCKWVKKQFANAVPATDQNADELTSEQESLYTYILYNEDNSVCQCQIYSGDYVIFNDLPEEVYYVAGAARLGDASFTSRKMQQQPPLSLYAKLYHSQLVYEDGSLLSEEEGHNVAAAYYRLKPKKVKDKPAQVEVSSRREYIFKYNGDTYMIEIYSAWVSITVNAAEVKWYRSSEKKIEQFLKNAKQSY